MRKTFTTALFIAATATAALAQPAPPPGCNTPESHQFDFWVGRWDVAHAKTPGKKIANSLIEKLYVGCAVRENWMPLKPDASGGSLNAYDSVEHKWRQFWADSGGSIIAFSGGWTGKTMVLEGPEHDPGQPSQTKRMTFTPRSDGSVEQRGETSTDGKTWTEEYDLVYRPAK